MKRKARKDAIAAAKAALKYNHRNPIDVSGLGFPDSEYERACCKYKWMFISPDMHFRLVYSYISARMTNEGGLRDNINDKLGLGNRYDVATSCDDFLIKTSPIFSKKFRNILRARFKSFEAVVGGKQSFSDQLIQEKATVEWALELIFYTFWACKDEAGLNLS
jgi:hypothetical protein